MSKLFSKMYYFLDTFKVDRHKNCRNKIFEIKKEYDPNKMDYGSGYFYQSIKNINLSGLRNTSYRINELRLNKYVSGKSILDIGTNCGGILFELEDSYNYAVGIEHNQNDIKIANYVKNYLDKKKISFLCEDFFNYSSKNKFDIILSLANHHTYDKGIVNTNLYIKKLISHLNDNGILFFEQHHPSLEKKDDFEKFVNLIIQNNFEVLDHGFYKIKNYYDYMRNYYIFKKKNKSI